MLFSAIESLEGGQHVNVLGAGSPTTPCSTAATSPPRRWRPPLPRAHATRDRADHPGSLARLPRAGMAASFP